MGLEDVWQVIGWVGYTFLIAIAFANTLPGNASAFYKKYFRGKNRLFPIAIPWIALIVIWIIVLGCCSAAAYLIWNQGNWTVYPIELLTYCITIIAATWWIAVFYNPCKERCNYLTTALFIALILSIITGIFFVQIYALSGILMIPLIIWLAVLWWIVLTTQQACLRRNFPVKLECEDEWVTKSTQDDPNKNAFQKFQDSTVETLS